MISQIGDLAARRKVTRSAVVETAVASLLSPDSAEKTEAALTRRLDRLTRQMQRQERDLMIALETHALFIRFWLGQMPPLPAEAQAAANALGQERFARFLDTLGRRLSQDGLSGMTSRSIFPPCVRRHQHQHQHQGKMRHPLESAAPIRRNR